jgi:ankyrin repeat protein
MAMDVLEHLNANAPSRQALLKYLNTLHQGKGPLHIAVSHNRLDVVKRLLELGADPNARDGTDMCSPLHVACLDIHFGANTVEILSTPYL